MKLSGRTFFYVLLILLFFPAVLLYADEGIFTAAGIQFEILPEVYESSDKFFNYAEESLRAAMESEYRPDLVVFPEYIGVFYQLIDFRELVSRHSNFSDALVNVLAENDQFENMADVFIKPQAWNTYLEGFGRLAEEYSVHIIAGSCFISDDGENLNNRTFVFNPEGRLEYQQDKVFLTDFEKTIIGLSPGRLEDAAFFSVEGHDLALTICRDAYSRDWELKYSGAFLWIDIKANGESYDEAQRQSFMRALPTRVMNSDVRFGMTVCAVGRYLDLFWEGESSAFYKDGERLFLADISDSADAPDMISINILTEQ